MKFVSLGSFLCFLHLTHVSSQDAPRIHEDDGILMDPTCVDTDGSIRKEDCTWTSENRSGTGSIESTTSSSVSEGPSSFTECSLYLAPSSIPNAGFGLYTTRAINTGEPILSYGEPDAPSIVVTNSLQHNKGTAVSWSHVDYFWSGTGHAEFESNYVEESVVTMGALANYHTYLSNIKPSSAGYDDSVVDRFENPSAGAFSYYKGHLFKAVKPILPGEELFADYGEEWLKTRSGSFADYIPRNEDYKMGAQVMYTLYQDQIKNGLALSDAIISTVKNVVNVLKPLVATTLPTTSSDYNYATNLSNTVTAETKLENKAVPGKAVKIAPLSDEGNLDRMIQNIRKSNILPHQQKSFEAEIATRLGKLSLSRSQHSVEWVHKNGLCLDNIIPGKSTIPFAGQGAFAARFLPEGSIISPSPLIQIVDRASILMYELVKDEEGNFIRKNDDPVGSQLILNYCFGHKNSRLLLCPQTNVILINHCSTRKHGDGQCGTKGPNAHIRWAGKWDAVTNDWLQLTLEQIDDATEQGRRGLSFEYIASRDINPGDEIFIDYGVGWEKAWDDHLEQWKPPARDKLDYIPLRQMLDAEEMDLRTLEEQKNRPYPKNIATGCHFVVNNDDYSDADQGDVGENDAFEYLMDGSKFVSSVDIQVQQSIYICDIIAKNDNSTLTVRVLPVEDYLEAPVVLTNYPIGSVTFKMVPLTSDQHLSGVFRHYMEIDDSMFPGQWKDQVEMLN